MFIDEIKENLEYLSAELDQHLSDWEQNKNIDELSKSIVEKFRDNVCSVDSIENYLKSILYSNLLEQFWSLFLLIQDNFPGNEGVLKSFFEGMIRDFPNNENGKISSISKDIHKSITSQDMNAAIQTSEGDDCVYELGCIGGAQIGSKDIVKKNKFLHMLSRPQLDHVWPKSRTPHHHQREEIHDESMILCEYHNRNKMMSMMSYIFKELEKS